MKSPFIERSIRSALNFFKDAVFSEETARSKGLLQSLDTRLKIVLFLILILVIALTRSIPVLASIYILSLILAAVSGINIFFFIKRVWVFIPLFTLVIAIPAIFMDSLYAATVFVLRVAASVSFVVLLTLTTRHSELFRAMRSFGIPAIFLQVLDMTYRYIFLFIKVFEEMHLALKARTVADMGIRKSYHWIASRMASLFTRSMKMSEDVYLAMLARGYTGEFKRGEK